MRSAVAFVVAAACVVAALTILLDNMPAFLAMAGVLFVGAVAVKVYDN